MRQLVKILGARGSVPVSGKAFSHFGGGTTCVFLRMEGQPLVLDAGSGLMALPEVLLPGEDHIPLLLTHPHADHLVGLPCCPLALTQGKSFSVYAAAQNGLGPREQLCALMAPPLWPVGPELLPAKFTFHTITGSFQIGPIRVETMAGMHPGGVTLYRLTAGGESVVLVTDCTLEEALTPKIADFARDCDLLLVDGQYSDEEWEAYKTFGHNTWTMAARLGQLCGAKKTRILHHAPYRTDAELAAAGARLAAQFPNCTFAYEGEEILL